MVRCCVALIQSPSNNICMFFLRWQGFHWHFVPFISQKKTKHHGWTCLISIAGCNTDFHLLAHCCEPDCRIENARMADGTYWKLKLCRMNRVREDYFSPLTLSVAVQSSFSNLTKSLLSRSFMFPNEANHALLQRWSKSWRKKRKKKVCLSYAMWSSWLLLHFLCRTPLGVNKAFPLPLDCN